MLSKDLKRELKLELLMKQNHLNQDLRNLQLLKLNLESDLELELELQLELELELEQEQEL
eukprot:gene7097-9040_t